MKEIPKYGSGVRGHFAFRDGELIQIDKPDKIMPNLGVIVDTFKVPVESMATSNREIFDSKSAYRRHLKEHGFRETGGEHLKDSARSETTAEKEARKRKMMELTKEAIMDVKYDRVPFTEQQKETFRREAEAWGKDYWLKT